MLTLFGVTALTFMTAMYAMEGRGRGFVLAFACGCVLASAYGFASGAWPFGILEAIWAAVAFRRYRNVPSRQPTRPDGTTGSEGKVGRFTG
jgi:hypothetical protein